MTYTVKELKGLVNSSDVVMKFVNGLANQKASLQKVLQAKFDKPVVPVIQSLVLEDSESIGNSILADEARRNLFVELACDTMNKYVAQNDAWMKDGSNPGVNAKIRFIVDTVDTRLSNSDDLGKELSESLGEFAKDGCKELEEKIVTLKLLETLKIEKDSDKYAEMLLDLLVLVGLRKLGQVALSDVDPWEIPKVDGEIVGDGETPEAKGRETTKADKDVIVDENGKPDETTDVIDTGKTPKHKFTDDEKKLFDDIKKMVGEIGTNPSDEDVIRVFDLVKGAIAPFTTEFAKLVNGTKIVDHVLVRILRTVAPENSKHVLGCDIDSLVSFLVSSMGVYNKFDASENENQILMVDMFSKLLSVVLNIMASIDGVDTLSKESLALLKGVIIQVNNKKSFNIDKMISNATTMIITNKFELVSLYNLTSKVKATNPMMSQITFGMNKVDRELSTKKAEKIYAETVKVSA